MNNPQKPARWQLKRLFASRVEQIQVAGQSPVDTPKDWFDTSPWVGFGIKTVAGLFGVFLIFSLVFEISGAVIASGVVTVEGSYQTVQHRDGGIVGKILVANGDKVQAGQVLISLKATTARAELAITTARINELRVQTARLEAERDDAQTFELPGGVRGNITSRTLAATIASQRALFKARLRGRKGERSMLASQVRQLQDQITGAKAQLVAKKREARLNAVNARAIQTLYKKGYASRQRLIATEQDTTRITGDLGRLRSEVARTRSATDEAMLRLAQAGKNFTQSVVDELRRVRTALSELIETRKAQAAKLARTRIRAPVSGFVHALAIHTRGGVIAPGKPLLQVIPVGRKLLIEARVKPTDIDKIQAGQTTTIRLPAFSARTTPQLSGIVKTVSAAQLGDGNSGSYFSVLVALAPGELAKIGKGHRLRPGMPADVFIETQSRSIMNYFMKPLTDAMTVSLREN